MSFIFTHETQATPERLTRLLRKKVVLGETAVITQVIPTHIRSTNVSRVCHLELQYTAPDTAGPRKLFLKMPRPEFQLAAWVAKEITFYTDIIPTMQTRYDWRDLPFIRCYDVAYNAATAEMHFLFEDISESYAATEGLTPPTAKHRQKAIDAFALIHAFWWEHPTLDNPHTAVSIANNIRNAQAKFSDFANFMANRLTPTQHHILQTAISQWPPHRQQRLLQGKGLTLVHRDPHPLNLLYERNGRHVKLIDWQSWRADTGTDDIAYFIACHWPAALRHKEEHTLLRQYHHQLIDNGVQNYTWADCWYDYRASVMRCLFFLLNAWSPAQWERGWWWPKVKAGIRAFQDLNCQTLV